MPIKKLTCLSLFEYALQVMLPNVIALTCFDRYKKLLTCTCLFADILWVMLSKAIELTCFDPYKKLLTCMCLCADILRVMPSKAIELTCFDAYKRLLSHKDEEGKLCRPGPLLTGLAGAAAGNVLFVLGLLQYCL